MWLRYPLIEDQAYRTACQKIITGIDVSGRSSLMDTVRQELKIGLTSLMGELPGGRAGLEVRAKHPLIPASDLEELGEEGFIIRCLTREEQQPRVIITANGDRGLLYGTHAFLRMMQLRIPLNALSVKDSPRVRIRMLNHWDNIFRGDVERGYAGPAIFSWERMGDSRQEAYARFLASLGINGTVINSVNTSVADGWKVIDEKRLMELRPLAAILGRNGIQLYLAVNFDSPIKFGDLETSDPLDPKVQDWWNKRADLIKRHIPNFGGFLVKADSEGQPGPSRYGRNHAEAANMLGRALARHHAIVLWRAFVYQVKGVPLNKDRVAQAYEIFHPLDGQFADNVLVQIKNGPLDFQPREAVSPLFGQMPNTRVSLELQVTQEYTGFSTHLCYLVPQWKYYLDTDTYAGNRPGTTLGDVVGQPGNAIAGVSNFGRDLNWTGHDLAQANAYGFGRLAWNPTLGSGQITGEWIRMTYGHDPKIVEVLSGMLLRSYPTYEDYTVPFAAGICADPGHFAPSFETRAKYHGADKTGIGHDRSAATGSACVAQYPPLLAGKLENIKTTPEELLAWFHHVPYTYQLSSGKTVIQHIYDTRYDGVDRVREFIHAWDSLTGRIDPERHARVAKKLQAQLKEAIRWRDAGVHYFKELSGIEDMGKRR